VRAAPHSNYHTAVCCCIGSNGVAAELPQQQLAMVEQLLCWDGHTVVHMLLSCPYDAAACSLEASLLLMIQHTAIQLHVD
jgi:hypothetical protein